MNLRELELKIVTEPKSPSLPVEQRSLGRLVTYESSAYLTPGHIDVTSSPARYARAKAFRFPSRHQFRAMDANRWVRQRIRATNLVAVSELPPLHYSLDKLEVVRSSPAFDRSTVEIIHNALLKASRHFHFARKTVG
jgi:hypothetical protein